MKTKEIKPGTIEKLIDKSNYKEYSFFNDFKRIILNHIDGYGKGKEALKGFLNDMGHGCQSGMIGEFIYHSDCKAFYINHIDSLEDFKIEMEENIGEMIQNKQQLPRYTFMCWLCFEEFCYNLNNIIFEQ